MREPPELDNIDSFLLNAPLYTPYKIIKHGPEMRILYAKDAHTLDGFCSACSKHATFTVKGYHITETARWASIEDRFSFDTVDLQCTRKEHRIKINFLIRKLVIQKIGQYPSLADIANDESKHFRSVLTGADSRELHKAIGLAAHGVGIGSFVYLRRIFERLIFSRFEASREKEGWDEAKSRAMRMQEKIVFMKYHLPSFLVDNHKIYAVLSVGIHQLEEEQCLSYFEIMKQSIMIILEDDKRRKEDEERRAQFAKVIAGFDSAAIPEAGED